MCDYVPGRLLLVHRANDTYAAGVIESAVSEGVTKFQRMSEKLEPYKKSINPALELDFVQLSVPEGDEVWWIAQLTERYHAQSVDNLFRQHFAVSLNHFLEPCAFTFTIGQHDVTYRQLMQESRSSGDGNGVRVKVINSGLSSICGIVATSEVNVVDPSKPTDVEDQNGHGTAVACIIHNLAPKAEFLIYKVKGSGPIIEWDVLAALADNDTAHIVNLIPLP